MIDMIRGRLRAPFRNDRIVEGDAPKADASAAISPNGAWRAPAMPGHRRLAGWSF